MLHRLILIVCFLMALYMTYLQFMYYLADEDMSPVSYKYFSDENDKMDYPTFSVCFFGIQYVFDPESEAFKSINVTPFSFGQFLEGNMTHYAEEHNAIQYDEVVLNINRGYLLSSYGVHTEFHTQSKNNFSMIPSYKLPKYICFMKTKKHRKLDKTNYDVIELNATLTFQRQLMITPVIHQKGRLIRSLRKLTFHPLVPKEYQHGAMRRYDINEIEVLRRRDKTTAPCNSSLLDEDKFTMSLIMRNVGCVPTYWEEFFAADKSLHQDLERCRSHEEYQKVTKMRDYVYWNFNSEGSLYLQPCIEMKVSTITTEFHEGFASDILRLIFSHNVNSYTEVANTKAYTIEMLLGQVGGFVGINARSVTIDIRKPLLFLNVEEIFN